MGFVYSGLYPDSGHVLKFYGLMMMPIAMVVILEHLLLAMKRIFLTYLLVGVAPLVLIFIQNYNSSVFDIMFGIAIWCVFVFVGGFIYMIRSRPYDALKI